MKSFMQADENLEDSLMEIDGLHGSNIYQTNQDKEELTNSNMYKTIQEEDLKKIENEERNRKLILNQEEIIVNRNLSDFSLNNINQDIKSTQRSTRKNSDKIIPQTLKDEKSFSFQNIPVSGRDLTDINNRAWKDNPFVDNQSNHSYILRFRIMNFIHKFRFSSSRN